MINEQHIEELLKKPSRIKDGNVGRIAKLFKIEYEDARELLKEVKKRLGFVPNQGKKGAKSIDEYLKEHNLKVGDVSRIKIYGNTDKPMYSVETKREWYGDSKEAFLEEFKTLLKEYKTPEYIPQHSAYVHETIGVINLLDAHIDKVTLLDETGKESSLEENLRIFEFAFNSLLSQTLVYNPEYIVFVVGSDFYNANDANNTTKKGTPQVSLVDWKSAYKEGYKLIRRCIDKAKQYTKVIVKVVKGNHDEDKIFYLGHSLEITYENDPNVVVDAMTKQRKYVVYGRNLIGLAHGDKEKGYITSLPATMMIENKAEMPNIDFCYFYLGDIHHKVEHHFKKSEDLKGCNITFLRPLSELSKWEFEKGYVGIPKSAESFIHHKVRGLINNIQVHI